MRIGRILYPIKALGPGTRIGIWVQGCPRECPGCANPELQPEEAKDMPLALVTGLVNFFFFPGVRLLGASGVVFACILLSSFTCTKERKIPITFILVALIYIGQQIYSAIFVNDNISNLAHLLGGAVGSVLGYVMNKNKMYNTSR